MDDLIREMLEPERPEPGVVARRRRVVATTTVIALAAIGVTSLTTGALFTNEDDSGSQGFVTGTIAIDSELNSFAVDALGAAPGDTHYAPVEVSNAGSLALRYAISMSANQSTDVLPGYPQGPGDLRDVLEFAIYAGAQCSASTPPTGPKLTTSTDQTLDSLQGAPENAIVVGNPLPGQHTGDRPLNVAQSELLCVALHLPDAVGDDYQNTAVDVELHFHAEQVANNP